MAAAMGASAFDAMAAQISFADVAVPARTAGIVALAADGLCLGFGDDFHAQSLPGTEGLAARGFEASKEMDLGKLPTSIVKENNGWDRASHYFL
jgi:hypothetical protein